MIDYEQCRCSSMADGKAKFDGGRVAYSGEVSRTYRKPWLLPSAHLYASIK